MIFDSDHNDRKSLEYCNNKKILNSAKKLKPPTPGLNLDHEEENFVLNKSVEIKQRSRNNGQKSLTQNKTLQVNKSQNALNKSNSGTL